MSNHLWQRLGAASGIVYIVVILAPDIIPRRCSTHGCDLPYHAYPRLTLLPVLLRKSVERPAARRGC